MAYCQYEPRMLAKYACQNVDGTSGCRCAAEVRAWLRSLEQGQELPSGDAGDGPALAGHSQPADYAMDEMALPVAPLALPAPVDPSR